MEWSGTYAPEGAEFLYLDTVLPFVMYTTIINKIQKKNTNTLNLGETGSCYGVSLKSGKW